MSLWTVSYCKNNCYKKGMQQLDIFMSQIIRWKMNLTRFKIKHKRKRLKYGTMNNIYKKMVFIQSL